MGTPSFQKMLDDPIIAFVQKPIAGNYFLVFVIFQ